MVEHLWIRLAELREEAALEEWRRKHPLQTALLHRLRRLRIRGLLLLLLLREQPAFQRIASRASALRSWLAQTAVRWYLRGSRWVRVVPDRRWVEHLRVRELMAELEARGIGYSDCVEKEDLLEALCGPCPALPERSAKELHDDPEMAVKDACV
ncbi:hypothetical protein AB1Y20_001950 [Prymnesium parvum]|uniref:Uncharacterized protein n=1 Tax=Prymnesium parvum TaxID=97485 RepID=A0AB34J9U2_PRYPA